MTGSDELPPLGSLAVNDERQIRQMMFDVITGATPRTETILEEVDDEDGTTTRYRVGIAFSDEASVLRKHASVVVTVPMTTLMGLDDRPGTIAGGPLAGGHGPYGRLELHRLVSDAHRPHDGQSPRRHGVEIRTRPRHEDRSAGQMADLHRTGLFAPMHSNARSTTAYPSTITSRSSEVGRNRPTSIRCARGTTRRRPKAACECDGSLRMRSNGSCPSAPLTRQWLLPWTTEASSATHARWRILRRGLKRAAS